LSTDTSVVKYFLEDPFGTVANRQTDRQTDKRRALHDLRGGSDKCN